MKIDLYNATEVQDAIRKLSLQINEHYANETEPVMTVAAMNGGVFFYVDLVRCLKFPVEMGVIATSHYPNGFPAQKDVSLKYVDANVQRKNVLLIDEICFTGKSLVQMKQILLSHGAKEVKTAVLVDQKKPESVHRPDFAAIEYTGDKWIAGMGMDINGLHRNVPEIFYFEKE